jgi:hypothetical protein
MELTECFALPEIKPKSHINPTIVAIPCYIEKALTFTRLTTALDSCFAAMSPVTPAASLAILPSSTSVVIVGAGPVGLLTAFQLSKFGWSDYIIIGESATLYPSSERLELRYCLPRLLRQTKKTNRLNNHTDEHVPFGQEPWNYGINWG